MHWIIYPVALALFTNFAPQTAGSLIVFGMISGFWLRDMLGRLIKLKGAVS